VVILRGLRINYKGQEPTGEEYTLDKSLLWKANKRGEKFYTLNM
jgi:hypothetical protein